MDGSSVLNIDTIIHSFESILNPNTDQYIRKNADQYLIDIEKNNSYQLLIVLLQIFENISINDQIRFQALLYFSNIIKRNWTLRRLKQLHSSYQGLKKNIRTKILLNLHESRNLFVSTYFDIIKFICLIDFPHNYPQFSELVIKLIQQIAIDQLSVKRFKQLKEIFYELACRKISVSRKLFEECLKNILEKLCMISKSFENEIHNLMTNKNNAIDPKIIKLSKYLDQLILSILRMTSKEILDNEQTLLVVKQLYSKLQHLINLHQNVTNVQNISNLEKNIKSLIYDLSSLQQHNPYMMSLIINDYFNNLLQIIVAPNSFVQNTTLKYTLLAMRKFIRQFAFYSDDELFMTSIGSKPKSKNYLELRKICHNAYNQCLNSNVIEGLLNHLIVNLMSIYIKNETISFDIEQSMIIDRNQQKQLSVQSCCIFLIESILQRFMQQSHQLIKNMINQLFKNNFQGINKDILGNAFSVLALLPKTCKKNYLHSLNDIPILQILTFCYQNPRFKSKIPSLISGWFDYFNNEQLISLINVLIQFIQNQSDTNLILHCCQSLDKIIITKKYILTYDIAQRIFPIAIMNFSKSQNPQLLWPMVNLVSNIILQFQFDSDIILQSLNVNNTMDALIANNSIILIEALSEMFKNILCVIPRYKSAEIIYRIVCAFLNNHLSRLSSINSEKVLNLWYIIIRQYSQIQNCNDSLINLYKTHFKNNLFYKTPTLIYILEQYMLLGFVQPNLNQFSLLILEFYQEAEEMDKVQAEQLKIAALSFQITLITRYNLKEVNNEEMLRSILKDFYEIEEEKISATVHNSLLSIINRYIILHREDFFNFLNLSNANFNQFYEVYFRNMRYLTSESAKKINTLAALSLLPYLSNDVLIGKLHYILMITIPSVQNYVSKQLYNPNDDLQFTGKIVNSSNLRFASNFLSQRKEQIRKKGMFDEVNLFELFRLQINNISKKLGTDVNTIAQNFPQNGWTDRFYNLL